MAPEELGFRGRVKRFHSGQKFIFLFWGLLLLLLLSPIIYESVLGKEIGVALQTMIFFDIIYTHINSKPLLICVIVMVAITLTSLWWEYAFCSAGAALVQCIAAAILCFFLDVTILRTISWESSINRNVVYGAVSTYLLLGFGCGFLFATIDLLHPGSFTQISPFQCGTFSVVPYWNISFLSLTTLGYMDAAPAWGITKSLAMVEAILGQLFLVVVVAMLVGLRISELIVKRQAKK